MTATSACGTGTKLPGKHCGQVGQPSPDAVTRTTAPVTAIPPWVKITMNAMIFCVFSEGRGRRSTKLKNPAYTRFTTPTMVVPQQLQRVVGAARPTAEDC